MKTASIFLFFLIAGSIFFSDSIAQKPVNEATLTYKISIESSNGKPALNKSLEGATLTVYIKGAESRSDMFSTLGTESNLYNANSGKGYVLKEYSGQKLMITLTKENWKQKNQNFHSLKFDLENTVQTIAGFSCKKASGTLDNGKTIVVWYLPGMVLSNKDYNNAFSQLPGIPVQYELESGDLKFTYTLTSISYDNIAAAKFDLPKAGYRVMTYDENQQLKKG